MRKLERLVVGPWGEASEDLDLFGESRVFATAMSVFENDHLIFKGIFSSS